MHTEDHAEQNRLKSTAFAAVEPLYSQRPGRGICGGKAVWR